MAEPVTGLEPTMDHDAVYSAQKVMSTAYLDPGSPNADALIYFAPSHFGRCSVGKERKFQESEAPAMAGLNPPGFMCIGANPFQFRKRIDRSWASTDLILSLEIACVQLSQILCRPCGKRL